MIVAEEDVSRFKELNIIAEFSPVLWYPTALGGLAGDAVGAERYARWMPIKEFVDAGATVTFGSDWPAGTPDRHLPLYLGRVGRGCLQEWRYADERVRYREQFTCHRRLSLTNRQH